MSYPISEDLDATVRMIRRIGLQIDYDVLYRDAA
jgi:hypothetical protein